MCYYSIRYCLPERIFSMLLYLLSLFPASYSLLVVLYVCICYKSVLCFRCWLCSRAFQFLSVSIRPRSSDFQLCVSLPLSHAQKCGPFLREGSNGSLKTLRDLLNTDGLQTWHFTYGLLSFSSF